MSSAKCKSGEEEQGSPVLIQRQGKKLLISPKVKADFSKWPKKSRKTTRKQDQNYWKFKGGGTDQDPLNLLALASKPPGSGSPLLCISDTVGLHSLLPLDASDPLKLNTLDDNVLLQLPKKRRRRKRRNTYHGGDESRPDEPQDKLLKRDFFNIDASIMIADTGSIISGAPQLPEVKTSLDNLSNSNSVPLPDQLIALEGKAASKKVNECTALDNALHKRQHSRKASVKGGTRVASEHAAERHYREKDQRFRYGNYSRYYGYRNLHSDADVRYDLLQRDWFENKDVLDIGCNVGHLTLWIAKNFRPASIKGLDIDVNLVKAAKSNIRHYITEEEERKFPISIPATFGPIAAPPIPKDGKDGFPYNVNFVVENYVPSSDKVLQYIKEQFDTILCLSVTKWIQLNWGDHGLKQVFQKVFRQLRAGGKFLLEPQPLSSYAKKKNLTAEHRANYDKMQFVPDQFVPYLLSKEVGFEQCELVHAPQTKPHGFQRPMYLLTKADRPRTELNSDVKEVIQE